MKKNAENREIDRELIDSIFDAQQNIVDEIELSLNKWLQNTPTIRQLEDKIDVARLLSIIKDKILEKFFSIEKVEIYSIIRNEIANARRNWRREKEGNPESLEQLSRMSVGKKIPMNSTLGFYDNEGISYDTEPFMTIDEQTALEILRTYPCFDKLKPLTKTIIVLIADHKTQHIPQKKLAARMNWSGARFSQLKRDAKKDFLKNCGQKLNI